MDTLKKALGNIGFTGKEIEIYTSLLELREASYTQLAKATGIRRTSLYAMVNKLQERGVVQHNVDTKTLSALPPAKLFTTMQSHVLQLHKLIPQLNELGKEGRTISRIKFYSGAEGIKQAYSETEGRKLRKSERKLYVISDVQVWNGMWQEHDPEFSDAYLKENKNLGYTTKALFSGEKEAPFDRALIPEYGFEARYLPSDYKHTFDLEIRPNSIIISDLTGDQPYAIKIISTELAQSLRNFFEFTWDLYGKK